LRGSNFGGCGSGFFTGCGLLSAFFSGFFASSFFRA
jgi:hypothetical protein